MSLTITLRVKKRIDLTFVSKPSFVKRPNRCINTAWKGYEVINEQLSREGRCTAFIDKVLIVVKMMDREMVLRRE